MSNRVMAHLEDLAPHVEQYSIDEMFLDIRGIDGCMDFEDFGRQLRNHVRSDNRCGNGADKNAGQIGSVGIQRMVTVWWRPGSYSRQSKEKRETPVTAAGRGDMGGWQADLENAQHDGFYDGTAAGARESCLYQEKLQRGSGENGPGAERRGLHFLEEATPAKQQIVCSRSFGERVTTYESMRQAVCQHAEQPKNYAVRSSTAGTSP